MKNQTDLISEFSSFETAGDITASFMVHLVSNLELSVGITWFISVELETFKQIRSRNICGYITVDVPSDEDLGI